MSANPIQSLPVKGKETLFYYPGLNVLTYGRNDGMLKASEEFGDILFSFFRGIRILKALKAAMSTPKHLFVEPSRECNLACTYCYANGSPESRERLPLEAVKKLIANYNFDTVSFLGGEPLINKNYFNSVFGLRKWNSFFISTNGLTIDPNFLGLVDGHRELSYQVSIEPEEWESRMTMTGIKQRVLLSVKLKGLKGHGVAFRVTIPEKAPHVFLKDFIEKLSEDVGSDDFSVSYWPATGKNLPEWIDEWIEESYDLLKDDVDNKFGDKLFLSNKYEPYAQERKSSLVGNSLTKGIFSEQGFRYHFCNAGHGSIAVGPDGKLHICHSNAINSFPEDVVSSKRDPLLIDSDERLRQVYKWVSMGLSFPSCAECPMKYLCGGGCAIDEEPPNASCIYLNKTFPLILTELNAYDPAQLKDAADVMLKNFRGLYEVKDDIAESVGRREWQTFVNGKSSLDESLRLTKEYWDGI